jgi:hypothetical protein
MRFFKAIFVGLVFCSALTVLLFVIIFIKFYFENIKFDYLYFLTYSLERGVFAGAVGALLSYFNVPRQIK